MRDILRKVWRFIVVSSADPRRTSLTVKAALLGLIPYTMQALDIVCQWGHTCTTIDQSLLAAIVETIANGVFYVLSLAAAFGVLVGLVRKADLTIKGQNRALHD